MQEVMIDRRKTERERKEKLNLSSKLGIPLHAVSFILKITNSPVFRMLW